MPHSLFSSLRLSAPTKHLDGRNGADELIERQKRSGAAWHLDPLRDALEPRPERREPWRIPAIYERPKALPPPPRNDRTEWNGGLPPRPPAETRPLGPRPASHPSSSSPRPSPSTRPAPVPSSAPRTTASPPSSSSAPSTPLSKPKPPQTPSSPDDKLRCHGTTGQGKRCTRAASTPQQEVALTADALRSLERMLDDLPKFCKQHEKQAMSEPGAFVGPRGAWVRFDEWIPHGLPTQTKLHLRAEMLKPPTATDSKQRGYIYVHEMAPSHASSTTYIKLGRALRPVDRLSQWTSQCPSRTPIVRGFFPQSSAEGYLRGAQSVADTGGPFHMRWERLCLLELAGWEAVEGADDDFTGGARRRRGKQCADCGKIHVELFEFPTGAFERRVRDVVLKWERWCGRILI